MTPADPPNLATALFDPLVVWGVGIGTAVLLAVYTWLVPPVPRRPRR